MSRTLFDALKDAEPAALCALELYGDDAQRSQAVEECSELITALMHDQRGRHTNLEQSPVLGEIADVLIMALQMAHLYGIDRVVEHVDHKAQRLRMRMEAKT